MTYAVKNYHGEMEDLNMISPGHSYRSGTMSAIGDLKQE